MDIYSYPFPPNSWHQELMLMVNDEIHT